MILPDPEPGLVISYAYLWRREQSAGQQEGRKDRPCVIVLAVKTEARGTKVTVAPITHSPPDTVEDAVELPASVKRHLRLDDERSWVVVSEVNQFLWPGFDVRPIPKSGGRADHGFLPPRLFDRIVAAILARAAAGRVAAVGRD